MNTATDPNEKTTLQILRDNLFTFFNTVLFIIALIFIGFNIYLNAIGKPKIADTYFGVSKFVFLIPAVMNVAMGTFQEIKSLKVIKRLRIVTSTKSRVVREGEIVGFAGLVGAGRSETMQCIFGLTSTATGTITLEGNKLNISSAVDAMKYGIAMVPENRKLEGLYHIQSVSFNTTIEVLHEIINHLRVNEKREHEITQEFIDKMQTKTPSHEQRVSNLSGGNQQKVMIGRWLATKPKVLILDEPTRGVDVGAKAEIYEIMNELTKQGVAIIMVSSELPEIINMADRVYVMYDGRITGCIDYENVSQEAIMHLATLETAGGAKE